MAKSDFGIRLKAIFDNATNAVIAAKLGVSEDAVGTYVRGRVPPAEKLAEITNLTNCNLHWLLTGKGEKYFRDLTGEETVDNRLEYRLKIVAQEQAKNAYPDAEFDRGGSHPATLRLLTDYLLATALVEFKIIDSVADVLTGADAERVKRFKFSRMSLDERVKQMIIDVTGGDKRTTADSKNESEERIIEPGKIVATIEPGKRRTG